MIEKAEKLLDLDNLQKECKERLKILREQADSATMEFRKRFLGSEDIEVLATLSHYNLSIPSRILVGWERLRLLLERLDTRALWVVLDDPRTLENEKRRIGGGDLYDFGSFGSYGSLESLENSGVKNRIFGVIREVTENHISRPEAWYITESLLGKMKGITRMNYRALQEKIGQTDRIDYTSVMELQEKMGGKDWIDWIKKAQVLHFGNIYREGLASHPSFLPDWVNSQPIGFWIHEEFDKELDLTTLHLLFYSVSEYIRKIKETAKQFKKEIPEKNIEEIVERLT